jgi:hypothetical protein
MSMRAPYGIESAAATSRQRAGIARMRLVAENPQPATLAEFIDAIRAGLVCDRCGRYVGGLARKKYLPPPYPVALDRITADDEVAALAGFEWHMLNRMREGNFVIRHPQVKGRCVSVREWAAAEDEEDEDG